VDACWSGSDGTRKPDRRAPLADHSRCNGAGIPPGRTCGIHFSIDGTDESSHRQIAGFERYRDSDDVKGHLKSDIPRLKRRAELLNRSIFFSTISAIVASFLVIVSFASAYLNLRHEYFVGLLLILSIAFFVTSLVDLALETRIAPHEFDHFGGK
jgi:hypothetical protein